MAQNSKHKVVGIVCGTLFIAPKEEPKITWELLADRHLAGAYRVEGVNPEDGSVMVAVFSGPEAKERATDYFEALIP